MAKSLFIFLFLFLSFSFLLDLLHRREYGTQVSLLLTPILPSYMVVPESNIANTHYSKKLMNPNVDSTEARPDNIALSIQRGCPHPV